MKPITITKANFVQEVLQSDRPVLLDFWAPWCGPCRMMGPIMDDLAAEQPNIKVCKMNVDEEQELAAQYRVMTIPTIAAFKEGKLQGTAIGVRPKEELVKMLGL